MKTVAEEDARRSVRDTRGHYEDCRQARGHYEVHSALGRSLTGQRLGHAGGESAGAGNRPLDRTFLRSVSAGKLAAWSVS
jgi:hypothetical protein